MPPLVFALFITGFGVCCWLVLLMACIYLLVVKISSSLLSSSSLLQSEVWLSGVLKFDLDQLSYVQVLPENPCTQSHSCLALDLHVPPPWMSLKVYLWVNILPVDSPAFAWLVTAKHLCILLVLPNPLIWVHAIHFSLGTELVV